MNLDIETIWINSRCQQADRCEWATLNHLTVKTPRTKISAMDFLIVAGIAAISIIITIISAVAHKRNRV